MLIASDGHLKLCDFGSAKIVGSARELIEGIDKEDGGESIALFPALKALFTAPEALITASEALISILKAVIIATKALIAA